MTRRDLALHLAVIAVLAVLGQVLPAYHHTNTARIMLLAVYCHGLQYRLWLHGAG